MGNQMRQPRTKEGMINYLAKIRAEIFNSSISIEAKKIRKEARENKDEGIIRLINRLPRNKSTNI